jgi:hypothetical protein
VEVIAETFMENTTSWGAGAIWEHPAYLVGPADKAVDWNRRSLGVLTEMSKVRGGGELGLHAIQ